MILITAYDDIPNNDLNLEIVKKPTSLSKLLQIIQQYLNWLPFMFKMKKEYNICWVHCYKIVCKIVVKGYKFTFLRKNKIKNK